MSLIKLQGNASGTGAFTIAAPNGNTDRTLTLPDATGTVLAAPAGAVTISSSAPSNSLTVDGSGNLGLGVTPVNNVLGQTFQIGQAGVWTAETGSNRWWIGSNWYYGSSADRYITTGHATLYSQQSGDHYWFSAPSGTANNPVTFTQTMSLTSAGNLLVGTTSQFGSPGSNGRLAVLADGSNYAITTKVTTTGSYGQVGFYNPNGVVGSITTSSSSTAYNTSSDYRLKEDWQPMTGASERVLALKPVNFAWKVDGSRVDGFLAHEAQEVVPEAVTGAKDAVDDEGNPKYQGIDQSKLVPLLTAALQEALAEIANLKTRLTALEAN